MKANIYIGLGGSGIQTVDAIKQQYINTDCTYNMATAFCAIDTDKGVLHNCISLSAEELVHIGIVHPYEVYIINKDKYDIPDKNINYLPGIRDSGAGQVRSKGHFCFLHNEDILKKVILYIYDKIIHLHLRSTEVSHSIDGINVHLFFSLCGGTGSGIFYDVAKLVKEIIPHSNIFVFAYSHNYFRNNYNSQCDMIKLNTYAALLELDYCFNNGNYQKEILNPFDKFIYIDTHLFYCRYAISSEDLNNVVIPNVAKCVSICSKYNIQVGGVPIDNKWISSMGFSEVTIDELYENTNGKELIYETISSMLTKASPLMDTKDGLTSLRFNEFHYPHTVVIMDNEHEDLKQAFEKSYLSDGVVHIYSHRLDDNNVVILRSLASAELSNVVGMDEMEELYINHIKNQDFLYCPFTTREFAKIFRRNSCLSNSNI